MTRAYVLDTDFTVLGLIDQSWDYLNYTRRFWGMDTFSMGISRQRLWADKIETGRLLYLPDEGDRIFLIEQITSLAEGSSLNDKMTVGGRSLEGIAMAERLVIPPALSAYDRVSATPAETAIKHFVTDHAGSGAAAARQVPGLNVIASGAAGVSLTVAGRYQTVFDIVKQVGLVSGLGWEIVFNPATSQFDFDVIVGVDRSASVFFDFEFETVEKWEELRSISDSKTVAVVAGQGEGEDRDVVIRYDGAEPTGFARREAFIDARDIEVGATSELQSRGDAFIAAAGPQTALEATVHQFGSFRYLTHWDLGDVVLVRDVPRGISYSARVVEVSVAFNQSTSAPTVTAVIDRPFPNLKEQVEGAGARGGAVDSGGAVGAGLTDHTHDATGAGADGGGATLSPTSLVAGNTFISGNSVELSYARTSEGPSYIDFHSEFPITDYDARLIRWNNAEGTAPGHLILQQVGSYPMRLIGPGGIKLEGTVTPNGLILPQSASPTPTAEGEIWWDTDGNFFVVGDGASQKFILPVDGTVPSTQAFGDAAATGSAAAVSRRDHKHAMPADPVTAHVAAADPHTGYVLESLIDAAGDLIVGSAADTVARLAKGTALQGLRVNAAGTGLEYGFEHAGYACALWTTTDYVVTSGGSVVGPVTFGSGDVRYDPLSMFDNAADSIVIPATGYYLFVAHANWAPNATGYRRLYIRKNGSNYLMSYEANVGAAHDVGTSVVSIGLGTAADVLTLYAGQNSGGNLNITEVGFAVFRIT